MRHFDLFLLYIDGNTNFDGFLNDDFLKDRNLDGNSNRLRYMNNFMYGNWDVLGHLDWNGDLLVNGNWHMLVDGYWNVLVHGNTNWNVYDVGNREGLGNMNDLGNVHDLGDLLDDGDLHWYRDMLGNMNYMRYRYKLVHGYGFRYGHGLWNGHDFVHVLDDLMYMGMFPSVSTCIGDSGTQRRECYTHEDPHDIRS